MRRDVTIASTQHRAEDAGETTGDRVADSGRVGDRPPLDVLSSCDQNLGGLVDAVLSRATVANEDWLFVLTTDHGGRGTTHGSLDDDNRRIWFVASGPSITPATIATGVSHMDTALTVLEWLGVTIDPSWVHLLPYDDSLGAAARDDSGGAPAVVWE